MAGNPELAGPSRSFMCGKVGPYRIAIDCDRVEAIAEDLPAARAAPCPTLRLEALLAVAATSPHDDVPRALVVNGSSGPIHLAGSHGFRLAEVAAHRVVDIPPFIGELGRAMGLRSLFATDEGFVFVLDVTSFPDPTAGDSA